jgi:hypothetical protein
MYPSTTIIYLKKKKKDSILKQEQKVYFSYPISTFLSEDIFPQIDPAALTITGSHFHILRVTSAKAV